MTPEARARQTIDALLMQAGWHVCDMAQANIHASRGVAIREFPLNPGHGFADYLLYIDAKAAGVIEAKKAGATLTGVEVQSARYAQGLPEVLSQAQKLTKIHNLLSSQSGKTIWNAGSRSVSQWVLMDPKSKGKEPG